MSWWVSDSIDSVRSSVTFPAAGEEQALCKESQPAVALFDESRTVNDSFDLVMNPCWNLARFFQRPKKGQLNPPFEAELVLSTEHGAQRRRVAVAPVHFSRRMRGTRYAIRTMAFLDTWGHVHFQPCTTPGSPEQGMGHPRRRRSGGVSGNRGPAATVHTEAGRWTVSRARFSEDALVQARPQRFYDPTRVPPQPLGHCIHAPPGGPDAERPRRDAKRGSRPDAVKL